MAEAPVDACCTISTGCLTLLFTNSSTTNSFGLITNQSPNDQAATYNSCTKEQEALRFYWKACRHEHFI